MCTGQQVEKNYKLLRLYKPFEAPGPRRGRGGIGRHVIADEARSIDAAYARQGLTRKPPNAAARTRHCDLVNRGLD